MSRRVRLTLAISIAVVVVLVAAAVGAATLMQRSIATSVADSVGCPRDDVSVDLGTVDAFKLFTSGQASSIAMAVDNPRENIRRIALTLQDVTRNGSTMDARSAEATAQVVPPEIVKVTPEAMTVDLGVASIKLNPTIDGSTISFEIDEATVGGQKVESGGLLDVVKGASLPTVNVSEFLPEGSTVKDLSLGEGFLTIKADVDPKAFTEVDGPLCATAS